MSKEYRFVWDEIVTYETYITAEDENEARTMFEDGAFTTYDSLATEAVDGYKIEVQA